MPFQKAINTLSVALRHNHARYTLEMWKPTKQAIDEKRQKNGRKNEIHTYLYYIWLSK
jgi:hypothetical protein